MVIDLWRTTKRENSTATPTSQPGWFTNHIQKEVTLKEETSVLNPTFILKMGGHDGQNYVWAFGRYYWVTEIISLARDLWAIKCKIDPLGSYRGHIRNTRAFVLYDATPNTELPDRRLGVKTTATYSQNMALMPWGFEQANGTRFIAITGDKKNEAGADATGVYSISARDIDDLGFEFNEDWNDLWHQATVDSGLDVVIQTVKDLIRDIYDGTIPLVDMPKATALILAYLSMGILFIPVTLVYFAINCLKGFFIGGKALENIKAAYWLPFNITDGTPVSQLALGNYVETLTDGAKKISQPIKAENVTVNIPWQYSDWRNVSNTEIQLFIPLIGIINIPSSAVKGHSTITIMCSLNIYSGTFAVKIRCGEAVLGTYGASCSSPILIGNSNVNMGQVVNTIAAAATVAAGVATGGVATTAAGAVGVIASGFESLVPINTSVGGIGGGTGNALGSSIWCTTICHNTSDNPADLLPIIGTPTNVLKQLNGSGFCQTMQAHMNMQAVQGESYPTAAEVENVDAALDSGVFLE